MRTTREELVQHLRKPLLQLSIDVQKRNKIVSYLTEQYNVPESVVSDYILGQKSIDSADNQMLFFLCDGLDKVQKKSNWVDNYFTDPEKRLWGTSKIEEKTIEWPLRFAMLQVSDDSWIGPVTVRQLTELYSSQLINYNTNTQRALKQYYVKGEYVYRIAINKNAVAEIKNLFHEGKYISNTITLNIPADSNADFYYDNKSHELVVKHIDMFDILDGYHRLLAMIQEYHDNEFDYPMELRITNYDDLKAKQFIYQEDQKTKMRKAESDTYNVYSPENKVISRLNMDPGSEIQGMIGMGDAKISQTWLSSIISIWFRGKTIEASKKIIPEVTTALMEAFNSLIAHDRIYEYKIYTYKEIAAVGYYAYKITEGNHYNNVGDAIAKLIALIAEDNNARLSANRNFTKTVIAYLDRIVKG